MNGLISDYAIKFPKRIMFLSVNSYQVLRLSVGLHYEKSPLESQIRDLMKRNLHNRKNNIEPKFEDPDIMITFRPQIWVSLTRCQSISKPYLF